MEKVSLKEGIRIPAVEKMNKYSEIRNPQSAIGKKGFTLIEIIILIVMAGILLPAIIVPFAAAVKGSQKPEMASTAMFLAQEKMEELTINEYLESPLDPISLTSYAGIAGFSGYQWQWEILYVDSDFNVVGDGIQPSNHRGYKRILVRVKDPQNDTYEIYSVAGVFPQ